MSDHPLRDALWNWFAMNWSWFVTTLIAVYAAAVATWREVQVRKEKNPVIKVKIFGSMELLDRGTRTPLIQARIEHHGGPSLTFSENCCSIAIENEVTRFLLFDGKLTDVKAWPHECKPYTSFSMSVDRKAIVDGLRSKRGSTGHVRIRAVFGDAILREWHSIWLTIDLATGQPVNENIKPGPAAR